MEAGAPHGLKLVGGEALNALRISSGFVHWGHDLAYTDAPHQMGLGFVCKTDKSVPFIGRDAYLTQKTAAKGPFLCSLCLDDPDALLHHNEPVLREDKIVGFVTSGAFSAARGAAIGLCVISPLEGETRRDLGSGDYTVLVEGRRVQAEIGLKPINTWATKS